LIILCAIALFNGHFPMLEEQELFDKKLIE
jgi:hypothetical protein